MPKSAATNKLVFPDAGDFAMRDPKFNKQGDLLVSLQLEEKAISIDDDFDLQVVAPDDESNGKWVKVAKDGDEADLVLVNDQESATKFQLSNGDLVVDIEGLFAGQRASTRLPATKPDDQKYTLQDIFFDTPDPANTRPGDKLEFSTTGSGFFYLMDKGGIWWPRFVLQAEKLMFSLG